jgi:hypothetical protein
LQSLSGSGTTSDNLVQLRSDSETTKYSYSIGGRFGFTFPSGMGLKTGFNISKVRRGFSFIENDGMSMDTFPTQNTISNTNVYTYIDIPLLFSYEMAGYGPFYYNINAGILFNMTFTAEGKFLEPNGSVADFTRGAENRYVAYEKEAGAALYASFGMHYVLNKTFDFIIEPNIKYSIGSTTKSDYPLDEKYTTVGLITGIRYKF